MKEETNEIVRVTKFSIVGIINTGINWVTFTVMSILGIHYILANVFAWIFATTNSYLWNLKWVFKESNESKINSSIKFIILNIFGFLINTAIMYISVEKFGLNKYIALVLATFVGMIINYLANKLWVFRRSE